MDLLPDFPSGPLDRYRKKASFNWKNLRLITEDESFLRLKMRVWNTLESDPLFHNPQRSPSFDEQRELTLKRMYKIIEYNFLLEDEYLKDPYKRHVVHVAILDYDPSVAVKLGLSYGLFPSTVRSMGTERHQHVIEASEKLKILSCFALTEIGHGTNTKAMRTTATYDPNTQEFILNSSDFAAAKCWAGNLGQCCTHGVVFAQLITSKGSNTENHGLHAFVVPIRSPKTLLPYPGIIVGDMGEKKGLNGIDNGFLLFQNYRIPRENLLNRNGDVLPDGTYVTPFKDPNKRFGASLGNLSAGRVGITGSVMQFLAKAIVIAVRYAAVRKQFSSGSEEDGSEESPILEYQLQGWRLLPYLASAYVYKIFSDEFLKKFVEFSGASLSGSADSGYLAAMGMEFHALSSASKPVSGWIAINGIQECREACGGHGYLKASALGDLRNDSDASNTYEGDNNVLVQQTSNWLLKIYESLQNDTKKTPLKSPMGSIDFLSDINRILTSQSYNPRSPKEATYPEAVIAAYKWLSCWLLKSTADRVKFLKQQGNNSVKCKNDSQVYFARTLSIAFIEHFILQYVYNWIKQTPMGQQERNVLMKLCSLYGAWSLEKHLATLYIGGLTKSPETGMKLREGILELCSSLKDDSVALADALAPPDFILNSALGDSNGQVYNNLQRSMMQAPKAMERIAWWKEIVAHTGGCKL